MAAQFSSFPIILAVCAFTGLVGYNYIIVCKHFPDGGGKSGRPPAAGPARRSRRRPPGGMGLRPHAREHLRQRGWPQDPPLRPGASRDRRVLRRLPRRGGLAGWGSGSGPLPSVPPVDVLLLLALIALTAIAAYHLSILIQLTPQAMPTRRRA